MSPASAQSATASRYARADPTLPVSTIRLDGATDGELFAISKEMSIGLSVDEMKRVRDYFSQKGRDPTDVELEALGQAWSEHCCYKSSKPVLKKNIYGIAEHKVFARGDAGIVEFDQDHFFVAKIESHNHPSAIEPYGGAATGVGGIIRDILCCGAQPLAMVDPLFFGPPDMDPKKIPAGVKHPRYLFHGVVEGIRDYGNRVGLPTIAGSFYFHEGFTWNCLVNVGCLGIMPKKHWVPNKAKAAGNVYVYAGGHTGRDGIHGVTFASAELGTESEEGSRSAVQVGDPITKEPLIHAVREIVEKGLLVGMKDFGGGGLSCVAGELAWDAKLGAEIDLEKIPLKVQGMAPWEIWVSESQERMMLVVEPARVKEVLHVFKKWDVTATECGRVIKEPIVRALLDGKRVLELDLAFSTAGPVYDRPVELPQPKRQDSATPFEAPKDGAQTLLEMLRRWNICSREWVIRQYDHTVRANTVLQPLQGKIGVASHGDATVLKPLEGSWKGLAVTCDVNPSLCAHDPYRGSASAMDEVVRNLASVGARLSVVCDNLNFGNPEDPKVMGQLFECTRGLADVARVLDVPFSSGNVSLYNDSPEGPVPPAPTLMALGLVEDVRQCVTTDLKAEGSTLYLVGAPTAREFGGSEYAKMMGHGAWGVAPNVDPAFTKRAAEAVVSSIEKGLVRACHDLSEGGLAVAACEMAFGGDLGVHVDLTKAGPDLRWDEAAFSETNTRWLIEVAPEKRKAFEAAMKKARVAAVPVGGVGGTEIILTSSKDVVVKLPLATARDAWATRMPKGVEG